MRFLHTADWQIGMKAAALGDAGARVREERLAAGRRVVETAKSHDVDFLLVAGDLFEDNAVDRVLVQKVVDILNSEEDPGDVVKLFKKTFSLNGSSPSLIIERKNKWSGVVSSLSFCIFYRGSQ